jgi:hypothetical protein
MIFKGEQYIFVKNRKSCFHIISVQTKQNNNKKQNASGLFSCLSEIYDRQPAF